MDRSFGSPSTTQSFTSSARHRRSGGPVEPVVNNPGPPPFFECAFDAKSLAAAMAKDQLLEKWLLTGKVRVTVPQYSVRECEREISARPEESAHARHVLNQFDRMNDNYPNALIEEPDTAYQTWEELEAAPSPPIHWNTFRPNDLCLPDSVPITRAEGSRMPAPIGSGRPTTRGASPNTDSSRPASLQGPPLRAFDEVEDRVRPLFQHVWWAMNQQEANRVKHIWVIISDDKTIERAASILGIPCLSLDEMRRVVRGEDPEVENRPVQLPSSLLSPKSSPSTKTDDDDDDDEIVFQGKNGGKTDETEHSVQRESPSPRKFETKNRSILSRNGDGLFHGSPLPTEPRRDRERRLQQIPTLFTIDSNTFGNRNLEATTSIPRQTQVNGGSAAGSAIHLRALFSQDPPQDAPTGPRRSLDGSEAFPSLGTMDALSSPNGRLHSLGSRRGSNAVRGGSSRSNGYRGRGSPSTAISPRPPHPPNGHSNARGGFASQSPSSNTTNIARVPNSPRPLSSGANVQRDSPREQRAPRHGGTYVPPQARDQARETRHREDDTNASGNSKPKAPMDPNSYERGLRGGRGALFDPGNP